MYVTCAVSNTTRPTIAGSSSSNRVASVKSPRSTTRVRSPSLTTCHCVSFASIAARAVVERGERDADDGLAVARLRPHRGALDRDRRLARRA